MLQVFDEFREKLDAVMLKAFGHRVVLWGYGYTGRFLEWYAEYYHSIKVDFCIEDNWPLSMPYEFPLFRSSLFDFQYKDVENAIVWLALPEEVAISEKLKKKGYIKGKTYFSFLDNKVQLLINWEFYILSDPESDPLIYKLYPLSRTNFLTPWTGSHISCP